MSKAWRPIAKPRAMVAVGVVGCGEISWNLHLPVLLSHPGARVAWVTDRDSRRASQTALSFGVPAVALPDSPADLPSADAVLLAIPYGVREPYYKSLGKRGMAVYVEKPFARRLAEHDQTSARFSPGRLAVGLQRRASGFAQMLRRLVESGVFGELLHMSFEFGEFGVRTSGRYSSNLELAGGGVLFEVGVHVLDLLLYASGAEQIRTRTARMDLFRGFDVETEAVLEVIGPAGRPVELYLLCTNLRAASMEIVVEFETATVHAPLGGAGSATVTGRRQSTRFQLGPGEGTYPETPAQVAAAHWTAFFEGLLTETPNFSSAGAIRVTTAALEQLYASAERP